MIKLKMVGALSSDLEGALCSGQVGALSSDLEGAVWLKFPRGLQKYLKNEPFKYEVKLMQRGLGEAILVLGEK